MQRDIRREVVGGFSLYRLVFQLFSGGSGRGGGVNDSQAPHPCLDQKKTIFLYVFIYIFDGSGLHLSSLLKILTRRRHVLRSVGEGLWRTTVRRLPGWTLGPRMRAGRSRWVPPPPRLPSFRLLALSDGLSRHAGTLSVC